MSLQSRIASTLVNAFRQRHKRFSTQAISALSQDISLVGLGIRQACLVDALSIEESLLPFIISALRKNLPLFENVILLHERSSIQTFFLNVPTYLFCRGVDLPWTTFVALSDPPTIAAAPMAVLSLLTLVDSSIQEVRSAQHTHITLPPTSSETMIALAGHLLEYPISYFPSIPPSSSHMNRGGLFLTNVPLDVFEVRLENLISDDSSEQIQSIMLMKFSCPADLREAVGNHRRHDSGTILAERIAQRWNQRLEVLGLRSDAKSRFKNAQVRVSIEHITLDGVAL